MKFLKLYPIVALILLGNNISYSQSWLWSSHVSGIEDVESEAIAVDSLNNVYVLIELYASVDIEGNNKTSYGDKDVLLAKFDENGIYQWSKVAGNINVDDPKGLFVDKGGNSYLTGSFEGDAKFDNDSITAYSSKDAFLAKYMPSGGLDWVINAGWGTNTQKGIDLTVDVNGFISVIGQFKDSVIFGDSIGAANCDTLIANGKKNYFYVKFDNSGKYVSSSAKHFISSGGKIVLPSIDVCSNNEYYITGYFEDTIFYETGPLQDTIVSNGGNDIAVYKIDNSGNLIWSKSYGDSNEDYCWGLAIDENDNGYITGYYIDSLQMDATTIISVNNYDIFIAKFEPILGAIQWLLSKGSTGIDVCEGICVRNNMVQISGAFTDTLFWNNDTLISSSTTNQEAFFGVYDYSGNEIKAEQIGTADFEAEDKAPNIVIDDYNNTYIAGYFNSDSLFIGNDTLENAFSGKKDIFITKYGCREVTFSYIIDTVTCPGGGDGEIIIQPSYPEDFTYAWSTFDTNDSITNISEGWHTVTVTNDYACSYVDSVEMISLPPLQTIMNADNIIINCLYGNDGLGIVTPIDGVSPFTYSWSSSTSVDSTASDLTVGTHYVSVTDQCGTVVDEINVDHIPTLTITLSSHSIIVLCETSTDGEAVVTTYDGVTPFDYQWSTSLSDTFPTNNTLPIGMHYVTITDFCNVPLIDSVRVNYFPTMNASITESEPTPCIDFSEGEAYIFTTSGVPPYEYLWDNGDTTALTTALDTGLHYVTVTDFCISIVDSIEIDFEPAMSIEITSSSYVSCVGLTDGQASVTITNGKPTIYYAWSGSLISGSSVNDLDVGWQYVTVTDYCNAPQIDSVYIGTMSGLNISLDITTEATCSNTNDGLVTITTYNGVSPFIYAWSGSTSTDSTANDLNVGWQYVTVTDVCGSISDSIEVTYITPLEISYLTENLLCYGDTTGEIVLLPTNGVYPYTYTWLGISDTDSIVSNLSADVYYFTVTDVCGSIVDSAEIVSTSPLSVSIIVTNESFSGMFDGEIDLIISGGTPLYSYIWDNGYISEDIQGVTEGTYHFTVTDINNCELADSAIIDSDKKYIEIHNAFTPNGDGKNDTWTIKYIETYEDCQVDIFNQWGMIIFSSQGYTEKWNGKRDNTGNELPAATYYYIIDLKDGNKPFTGSVSIIK